MYAYPYDPTNIIRAGHRQCPPSLRGATGRRPREHDSYMVPFKAEAALLADDMNNPAVYAWDVLAPDQDPDVGAFASMWKKTSDLVLLLTNKVHDINWFMGQHPRFGPVVGTMQSEQPAAWKYIAREAAKI